MVRPYIRPQFHCKRGGILSGGDRRRKLQAPEKFLIEKTADGNACPDNGWRMRGSLDDENYTFFYVNDELCNMLGYTYDEFMEMSGGTAKGAIYPPDVMKAMKDCRECFKKGTNIRQNTESEKDGTLLWVMDYGKECKSWESLLLCILY